MLERSVPAISKHGNIINRLHEDRIKLPAKSQPEWLTCGVSRPPLSAAGHRPSLVHCLVGPDVRWSVPGLGWSVWTIRWASFALATQDAIFCDFACVFFVFSSYSGLVLLKLTIHQHSWNLLVITPTTTVDVPFLYLYAGVDGIYFGLNCRQQHPHT